MQSKTNCLFLIKQNKHLRTLIPCFFFHFDFHFGPFKIHLKLTQLAIYRSHKWETKMFATQLKFFHLFLGFRLFFWKEKYQALLSILCVTLCMRLICSVFAYALPFFPQILLKSNYMQHIQWYFECVYVANVRPLRKINDFHFSHRKSKHFYRQDRLY